MKFSLNDYGIQPDTNQDAMPALHNLLDKVNKLPADTSVIITCQKGTYHFYPDKAFRKVAFISNHDQQLVSRRIAFLFNERKDITLNGQDSDFIFHGTMIPVAAMDTLRVTLKNFSADSPAQSAQGGSEGKYHSDPNRPL